MSNRPLLIRLAGGCSVATADGSWERRVPSRQARLVLARLAVAEGPVTRHDLASLLWRDQVPSSWERHLSALVSRLRRILGDAPESSRAEIVGGHGSYELRLPPDTLVDVVAAGSSVRRAQVLLSDGRLDEALAAAEDAAAVGRRPFLPGADALWVDERNAQQRQLLLDALDIVVEIAIRRRDPTGRTAATEAVGVDPYREAGHVNLMRLHLANAERAAALEAYDRCSALLVENLGMTLSTELEGLREAALTGAGDGAPVTRDEHRSYGALPMRTTSFVGRAEVMSTIGAALWASRLITVVGPGGVGKSRCALEAALQVAERHRDGVRFCELAYVDTESGVPHALAASLGVLQARGSTLEESLLGALAMRDVLVVLDNCEHVLDTLAPLLERILSCCPDVRVLTTSRERIGVREEVVVPVPPLEEADALHLLRDRVQAVRTGFRPDVNERTGLTAICRRLDGLPLALELVAGRVAALGGREVADRLDRRFGLLTSGSRIALPRHRSLRATIQWSYDLLDENERQIFDLCSVFVGGFTLGDAERLCAAALGARELGVAEIVASLVDKSILVVDERTLRTRYVMLETLREFGRDRLIAIDRGTTSEQAHAECFRDLVREAEPQVRGPGEGEWVTRLTSELGNLRAALRWALRSSDPELAVEISGNLNWFSFWRMHAEVLSWAEDAVSASSRSVGPQLARALGAAGTGAWMRGDLERASVLGRDAVAAAGPHPAARYGWHVIGDVALFRGRLEEAISAYQQAAALARHDGDDYHEADMLGDQALVRCYSGEVAAARDLAEEARNSAERANNPTMLAWSSYVTGEVLMETDADSALAQFEQARALAETVSSEFVHGVALVSAASLRARYGDLGEAVEAFVDAMDHWERAGNRRQQWVTLRGAADLFVRLRSDRAAAVVLGAIAVGDDSNLYGADAERLSALRKNIAARLGSTADAAIANGRSMSLTDVVAFARCELTGASPSA